MHVEVDNAYYGCVAKVSVNHLGCGPTQRAVDRATDEQEIEPIDEIELLESDLPYTPCH